MKFHTAPVVQYFRLEIVGFILRFFIISNFTKEYKAAGGSGINGQIAVIKRERTFNNSSKGNFCGMWICVVL